MYVDFQRNDRQHDQNLNNNTFVRLPVISAQVVIGTEKYPDSGNLLNYNDDDYSQGYGQCKEAIRALTEDNIPQPYISEDDFISSKDGNDVVYNIHCFDIRYKKTFENAQPVNADFNFSANILARVYGYTLVLPNRLASISSVGQFRTMFDLI